MTTLVLENFAALPTMVRSLRTLLVRLARAIDALIRVRAVHAVPEWQMRQARREISRYHGLIRAGEIRQKKQTKKARPSNDILGLGLSESAISNFSR